LVVLQRQDRTNCETIFFSWNSIRASQRGRCITPTTRSFQNAGGCSCTQTRADGGLARIFDFDRTGNGLDRAILNQIDTMIQIGQIQDADGKLLLTHAWNNSEFSLAALNSFRLHQFSFVYFRLSRSRCLFIPT
jgi:hypothetical protein